MKCLKIAELLALDAVALRAKTVHGPRTLLIPPAHDPHHCPT